MTAPTATICSRAFGCLFGLLSVAGTAAELTGHANAIDGDSVRIGATELRLEGIDAPEFMQTCRLHGETWACGRAAAETLALLIQRKPITCIWSADDQYGRGLATCYRTGHDLNALMVESGMALAYRRYTERYIAAEERARTARRGLWDAEFEPPWVWRRRAPRGHTEDEACAVKGNVNAKGQRIYHLPGTAAYDKVRIKPDEGDRCFASAREAQAAGFRPPRR